MNNFKVNSNKAELDNKGDCIKGVDFYVLKNQFEKINESIFKALNPDKHLLNKRKDLCDFLGGDTYLDESIWSDADIEMEWYKQFQHDYAQDIPF